MVKLAKLIKKSVSPAEKKKRKARKEAKAIAEAKARGWVPPKGVKPAKKARVYK